MQNCRIGSNKCAFFDYVSDCFKLIQTAKERNNLCIMKVFSWQYHYKVFKIQLTIQKSNYYT